MTDQELDQMMRRALLDAAAQEAEALPQEPPELSPRHGRSMRAMLRDPLAWARSRRRPALRTAARHAAAVLLVLVLSAAVLVTVSPQVQADITRWVVRADRKRPGLPVPRRFPRPAHSAISDHRPAGGICGDGADRCIGCRKCDV